MKTLLILGGTSEAASLAEALSVDRSIHVITSLAGRTTHPRKMPGEFRTGGFGGASGLSDFLCNRSIDAVIDATHPFAAQMSSHAEEACRALTIPRLYLERSPWLKQDGDVWHEVDDANEAVACLRGLGRRIFLSTGHQNLAVFAILDDLWFLIRTIEPIERAKLTHSLCLQARGPFSETDEIELLKTHRIDVLVTKASGGTATYAKIAAARQLSMPVVMIKRPLPPEGPVVDSVEAAEAWLQRQVTDQT